MDFLTINVINLQIEIYVCRGMRFFDLDERDHRTWN